MPAGLPEQVLVHNLVEGWTPRSRNRPVLVDTVSFAALAQVRTRRVTCQRPSPALCAPRVSLQRCAAPGGITLQRTCEDLAAHAEVPLAGGSILGSAGRSDQPFWSAMTWSTMAWRSMPSSAIAQARSAASWLITHRNPDPGGWRSLRTSMTSPRAPMGKSTLTGSRHGRSRFGRGRPGGSRRLARDWRRPPRGRRRDLSPAATHACPTTERAVDRRAGRR